jgi:hypothetical protein
MRRLTEKMVLSEEPRPFGARDHHGLTALHDGDHRVGGAQVNANDFAHFVDTPSTRELLFSEFTLLMIAACCVIRDV